MIDERFRLVGKPKTFMRLVQTFQLSKKRVLDIGCGFGEYLAHFGPGSVGLTTTPAEKEAAAQRGLSVTLGNAEEIHTLNLGSFDVIWANNLFEHLLSPHAFLMHLRSVSLAGTTLILGVPVVPRPKWLLIFLRFRGSLASNHINFFTRDSLILTVARAGWTVRAARPFIFGSPFLDALTYWVAPHMYVVAEYNPDFSYPDKKVKEWKDEPYYQELLNSTNV